MLAVVLALLAAAALALVIYFLSKGNNMSVHIGGRGPGNIDRIPLKPTGLGGNLSGITAPTLTLQTASGASPASWNVAGDSTFQPGMYVHQQFASDSGFTTGVTDYLTQIQGSDWEANSSTIGNGLVTYVQPTGTYFQRARFETAPSDSTNNAVSPWSNTQTDTITTSSAVLNSSDKNNSVTLVTSYQAHASDQNADCQVRATIAQANQKGHFEVVINALGTLSNGNISAGITDKSIALATSYPNFGQGTNPGASLYVLHGSTSATYFINGSTNGTTLPAVPAVGDAIIVEYDFTAHTITFKYYQASNSTTTVLCGGPLTMTSVIPSTPYAVCGGFSAADTWTFNPGHTAFLSTPSSGYTYYG